MRGPPLPGARPQSPLLQRGGRASDRTAPVGCMCGQNQAVSAKLPAQACPEQRQRTAQLINGVHVVRAHLRPVARRGVQPGVWSSVSRGLPQDRPQHGPAAAAWQKLPGRSGASGLFPGHPGRCGLSVGTGLSRAHRGRAAGWVARALGAEDVKGSSHELQSAGSVLGSTIQRRGPWEGRWASQQALGATRSRLGRAQVPVVTGWTRGGHGDTSRGELSPCHCTPNHHWAERMSQERGGPGCPHTTWPTPTIGPSQGAGWPGWRQGLPERDRSAHVVPRDISHQEPFHTESPPRVPSWDADSGRAPRLFGPSAGWPWGGPVRSPNLSVFLCKVSPPPPEPWLPTALPSPEQSKNHG